MYQQRLGHRPALIQFADQVLLGYFYVVEEGLAEFGFTADQGNRCGTDAGTVHVDQQKADAFLLFDVWIRAHQAEDPVALVSGGGPDFAAIDEEVVAPVLGLALQAGKVGAGAGFGIALGPAGLTVDDGADVLVFLLFITVFEDGRSQHPDANAVKRCAGLDALHLFFDDSALTGVQPAAAVMLWPLGYYPALVAHTLKPESGILAGKLAAPASPVLVFGCHRLALGFGAIACQPLAHVGAELLQFFQSISPDRCVHGTLLIMSRRKKGYATRTV